MEVNLGSRMWNLRTPAYGLEGHVEGFVKMLGEQTHVRSVDIKVAFIFDQLANFTILPLLRRPSSGMGILSSERAGSAKYLDKRQCASSVHPEELHCILGRENRFSIALPFAVDIKGNMTPSFVSYLPNTCCEIAYVLKIDMACKGFRQNET